MLTFVPAFKQDTRIIGVCNVFSVRKVADYIHITYHVSPPGNEKAAMDEMKLQFRFKGKDSGKILVWWDRPQKYRNRYPHHMLGLGVTECVHDVKAFDRDALHRVRLRLSGVNLI